MYQGQIPFSLDHLNDVEFEEFCYDLLGSLGFVNLNWRRGTGLSSSPADSGRDIECQREASDIDGNKYLEKWFVECKHYQKGIPPAELQNMVSWATAENPDTVLIIASNFLSNPSKDYLATYQLKNKPRFRIKIWEKPDIQRLTANKSQLLRKYRIVGDFPFLSILHPAHILYMRGVKLNSLDYLFKTLDQLERQKRDSILSWIYGPIIQPKYRKPVTGKETLAELCIDDVSYDSFKRKCYAIAATGVIHGILLVFLIVTFTLHGMVSISDKASTDESISKMKDRLDDFKHFLKVRFPNDEEDNEEFLGHLHQHMDSLPARLEENYSLYEYFCNNVVSPLLSEDLLANQKIEPFEQLA